MNEGLPIKLKICGMKVPGNIDEVSALKPDYMGFIFYEGSPRFVGKRFTISSLFPQEVRRVGVFVNTDTAEILQLAESLSLDVIQLHGDEPVSVVKELKKNGLTVFKVFAVDDEFDFAATKPFQEHVDYFLFDTKGKHYGGNAIAFNWDTLQEYDQQVPFLLSGGLNAKNLDGITVLKGMNIAGVDLNSGVEILPGLKDVEKIKEVQKKLQEFQR